MSICRYSAIISILFMLQTVMNPASGGEEFKASKPDYYTCSMMSFDHMQKGETDELGNRLSFDVWLKGQCWPFSAETNLPTIGKGWPVTVIVTYNYGSKQVTERVETDTQFIAVQDQGTCPKNPWAHEVSCNITGLGNHTGITLHGPYPLSAELITSQLRKQFADWETALTAEETLANWNPYAPTGGKEISITKPTVNTTIAGNAPDFDMEFNALYPQANWVVQLEWARIDPAKDPSIEKDGHWVMNTPPTAPKQLPWNPQLGKVQLMGKDQLSKDQQPGKTKVHKISRAGFTPGMYAVRAKIQTSPGNTWTDWAKFWVGEAYFNVSQLQAAYGVIGQGEQLPLTVIGSTPMKLMSADSANQMMRPPTARLGQSVPGRKQLSQTTGDKTPTNGGTSAKIKPIGTQAMKIKPGANQALKIRPAEMQTMQGQAPAGVGAALGGGQTPMMKMQPKPVLPAPPAQSAGRTAVMPLKQPSLWIDNNKGIAMKIPELNKSFGVSVQLANLGSAANGNGATNKVAVKAVCVPLGGGACKTNLSLPVPVIQPGQSKGWGHLAMFTATKTGKYRVTLSIEPATKAQGRLHAGFIQTWSKDFTIGPVPTLKPAAAKELMRNPALVR